MNHNVYDAPKSELLTTPSTNKDDDFYIVSEAKFLVLFISTLGIYGVYWFYRNWKLFKAAHRLDIWPVPRAIFSIFFTHSLFTYIDSKLRDSKANFSWQPDALATSYVALSIISHISDRLSWKEIGSPYSDLLSFAMFPAIAFVLFKAQQAINIASSDPKGESNSAFTTANYVWIFIGLCIWLMAVVGILAVLGFIPA